MQTDVRAKIKVSTKIGEYDFVSIELEVADFKREVDKDTNAAIDRVYALVEQKAVEKIQEFIEKGKA